MKPRALDSPWMNARYCAATDGGEAS